jgi:hypothetical protein
MAEFVSADIRHISFSYVRQLVKEVCRIGESQLLSHLKSSTNIITCMQLIFSIFL